MPNKNARKKERVKVTRGESKSGNRHGGGRQCEVCGNDYDKSFEIIKNGISHYFDSFECAISALAPTCAHCKCRIIGHGMESGGNFFCCAHCASQAGVMSLSDRT